MMCAQFFKHTLCQIFFCTLGLWISSVHAHAQIIQSKLENGLKIMVKPDHRAPVAIVMLWYHVGSSDEPGGNTGLAHALEHMMFKGTPQIPAGEFSKRIAAAGGQDNAFTHQDYTAYFEKINVHSLELALRLEADRMQHLALSAQEFRQEIQVIQEERRMRVEDDPTALALERLMAAAYLTPAYQHPVIGWMSDLQHMQLDELQKWHDQYYAPNHATLVIVGDVDPNTTLKLIKKYFDSIAAQPALPRLLQEAPPALGKKDIEVHAPAKQPLLLLSYTVPSLGYAHLQASDEQALTQDAYTLEVIAGILDAGDNGRLTKHLIQQQHWVVQANAYYDLYTRLQTQFIFSAVPSPQHNLKKIQDALHQEIKQLQTQLISKQELTRIQTQLIAQYTYAQDSLFAQAMQLGLLDSIGLSNTTFEAYPRAILSIKPEQIRQCARKYFCAQCLTQTQLLPSADPTHV